MSVIVKGMKMPKDCRECIFQNFGCTGYGDDYYYDEETGEDVKACDGCPWNEDWEDW